MTDENVTVLAPRLKVVAESDQLKRIEEATKEENNRKWTVEDMLVDALARVRRGELAGNAAALILYDSITGDVNWGRCNLNNLEFNGLLIKAAIT